MTRTNTNVDTPLGVGISQGRYAIRDQEGEMIITGILVRLPVDDRTRAHLNQANCLTPRAVGSALFVFAENEVAL